MPSLNRAKSVKANQTIRGGCLKHCKKCGETKELSEFYTRPNGQVRTPCKECHNKSSKRYQEQNRDKIKEMKKSYYEAHKDEISKKTAEYYQKNAEAKRQYQSKYRKENPDKVKEIRRKTYLKNRDRVLAVNRSYRLSERGRKIRSVLGVKYRASVNNAEGSFSLSEWEDTLKYFRRSCCYCGSQAGVLHKDHFIPLSKGGSNRINNIVPACESCNCSKKDNDPYSWYEKSESYCPDRMRKILDHVSDSLQADTEVTS